MANRVRNYPVQVYYSDEELILLRQKMQRLNIKNMSRYIRKMTLDGYILKKDYTELLELAREINKIGVNINQVVHRINAKDNLGHPIKEDVIELEHLLNKVYTTLNFIVEKT